MCRSHHVSVVARGIDVSRVSGRCIRPVECDVVPFHDEAPALIGVRVVNILPSIAISRAARASVEFAMQRLLRRSNRTTVLNPCTPRSTQTAGGCGTLSEDAGFAMSRGRRRGESMAAGTLIIAGISPCGASTREGTMEHRAARGGRRAQAGRGVVP